MITNDTTYNGWKNYQTWNVALWVSNDEPLYRDAAAYASRRKAKGLKCSWRQFVCCAGLVGDKTPDGCAWAGTRLDTKALSAMLDEFND